MNIEKTLSSFFSISGLILAAIFLVAIIPGVVGLDLTIHIAQAGIIAAIAIPVIGLFILMLKLIAGRETKYGICAIILLVFLIVTVVWRLYS